MAKIHAKNTYVSVDANDLSTYTDSSDINRSTDTHDTTCYGADSHAYSEGLADGTFSMGGTYDSTASTGPRAVLNALIGAAAVTVIRRPEGTGSGLPQDSFSAICKSYVETNPVTDMVKWTAEFQISGDVDSTAQSA